MARKPDNTWVGWGANGSAQLGTGTTTNALAPVPAAFGLAVTNLVLGFGGACGLAPDGAGVSWGTQWNTSTPWLPAFPVTSEMTLP